MQCQLDHIVIAHPNLERAMEEFADLTGCKPAYGGPHIGGGTHNALVSLGDSVYLELISPDPAQTNEVKPVPGKNLGQRLKEFKGSQLLAWAIRSNALDEMAGMLHGIETAKPFDMSRQQPGGDLLRWRLMNLLKHELQGFAPFYIDWLQCPHPCATNPVAGEFLSLKVTHPDQRLADIIHDTTGVEYEGGAPGFMLEFSTSKGPVIMSSQELPGFWG